MLQVSIDVSDVEGAWRAVVAELARGVVQGLVQGLQEGERAALSTGRWTDRTGETRRNTRGTVDFTTSNGGVGTLESRVPWASYLDAGTRPHKILPKEGHGFVGALPAGQSRRGKTDVGTHRSALRWHDSGGQVHFARVVNHPGTRGTGYMGAGAQQVERTFERVIGTSIARAQDIADRY